MQLLKDTPDIHRNSNWEDAKHKLDSDPRYVAVNSSPKREEWFKEYIKGLVGAINYLTFPLLTVEIKGFGRFYLLLDISFADSGDERVW